MSLLLYPAMAQAGVTRLQIDRREVVLNGQPFGVAGPYEKIAGTVYFVLDPALPQNRGIVDLNLAPKNAQGLVEFSADFYLAERSESCPSSRTRSTPPIPRRRRNSATVR